MTPAKQLWKIGDSLTGSAAGSSRVWFGIEPKTLDVKTSGTSHVGSLEGDERHEW